MTNNQTNLSYFPSQQNETEGLPFDNSVMAVNILFDLFSPILQCEWLPFNHISFHIASLLILISFLSPNGIYGILWLRTFMLIGSSLMVLWGWLIFCSRDFAVWNALFAFINLVHIVVICVHICHSVKFPSIIEQAYFTLFKPLKVSRQKFEKILKCKYEIKAFPRGTTYAIEDFTKIETLGLILRGR